MFCTCWWSCFVPVGGHVVAVLRQEVVADLGEEIESDASTRNIDAVVDFTEERVERNERKVFAEELVGKAIYFEKSLQLL